MLVLVVVIFAVAVDVLSSSRMGDALEELEVWSFLVELLVIFLPLE